MKALVTGGAGFIGSNLVNKLLLDGVNPIIIDNLSTGNIKNIGNNISEVEFIDGDIRDEILVQKIISRVDLVFHMAASVGVKNILNAPTEGISTNIYGSEIVLNGALKYGKRIVIASTSEIYGKNPTQPLSENSDRVIGQPQKLRWTYSDSKAIEEAIATHLFETKNLQVSIVRLFNTVGPGQSDAYGMVLPRFIKSALSNKPIEVYGTGKQSRVFCHVQDVVDAITKISSMQSTVGEVYNIGGTEEITIEDLAIKVISQCNSTSKVRFIPYSDAYSKSFEETFRRVPDISKINSELGWSPKKSLEETINDVIVWCKLA
jgi:UDP-glucose 4-epimerase